MADFAAIRDGLKSNLQAISGLNVYDVAPDAIIGPAVVITPPDGGVFLEYDSSMDEDSDDLEFVLHLFVDRRDEQSAQDELDAYLAKTGASSVYAAVRAAAVASTQYAEVMRAFDYGGYDYAGSKYLGCKFTVEVGAV